MRSAILNVHLVLAGAVIGCNFARSRADVAQLVEQRFETPSKRFCLGAPHSAAVLARQVIYGPVIFQK